MRTSGSRTDCIGGDGPGSGQCTGSASFLTQARSVAADLARTSTATAQAAPADDPPPVKVTGGIDFPTLYLFRGIRQEGDPAFTLQPFVNLAYRGLANGDR